MNAKSGKFWFRQHNQNKKHPLACWLIINKKELAPFSDCDTRNYSFPLPWELHSRVSLGMSNWKGCSKNEEPQKQRPKTQKQRPLYFLYLTWSCYGFSLSETGNWKRFGKRLISNTVQNAKKSHPAGSENTTFQD